MSKSVFKIGKCLAQTLSEVELQETRKLITNRKTDFTAFLFLKMSVPFWWEKALAVEANTKACNFN